MKGKDAITKIDALAMYSSNPSSMPAALLSRERVIVGILASKGVPMHAEAVRKEYLSMVLDNVKSNIVLLDLTMMLDLLSSGRGKWLTPEEVSNSLEKAQAMYTQTAEDKEWVIKSLSDMFHKAVPKKRKASIVINGMTVQSILENLAMFYSNFMETREMPSGRKFYYLNAKFRGLWLKHAAEISEIIGADIGDLRAEMQFYGAVNSRLGRKCEWGISAMGTYVEYLKVKREKELGKWVSETKKGLREIGVTEKQASKKATIRLGDALMPLDESVAEYLNVTIAKLEEQVKVGISKS